MASPAVNKYVRLRKAMDEARKNNDETAEERILSEMDDAWYALSDDDIKVLHKFFPAEEPESPDYVDPSIWEHLTALFTKLPRVEEPPDDDPEPFV